MPIPFSPELISLTTQGAWNYTQQRGVYKVIDEFIFYSFVVTIDNITTAGGGGDLYLTFPVPAINSYSTSIFINGSITNAIDFSIWTPVTNSRAVIAVKFTAGHERALAVSDIASGVPITVRGQIFYRYK